MHTHPNKHYTQTLHTHTHTHVCANLCMAISIVLCFTFLSHQDKDTGKWLIITPEMERRRDREPEGLTERGMEEWRAGEMETDEKDGKIEGLLDGKTEGWTGGGTLEWKVEGWRGGEFQASNRTNKKDLSSSSLQV